MSAIAEPKKRIALRCVGEILTDHTGHFYELRGDDLRELGKLLIDRRGRVFEIAEAEPPTVETESSSLKSDFSVQPQCSPCLCGYGNATYNNHRGMENTEVAQRRFFKLRNFFIPMLRNWFSRIFAGNTCT